MTDVAGNAMLAQTLAQAQVTSFGCFVFYVLWLKVLQGVAETAPDRAPEDVCFHYFCFETQVFIHFRAHLYLRRQPWLLLRLKQRRPLLLLLLRKWS
jgi:hypothetical protein